MTELAPLAELLAEAGDLKRIRPAGDSRSLAERLFTSAWGRVVAGDPTLEVALDTTAAALAGARLGGIDGEVLRGAGLTGAEVRDVLRRSFDAVAGPVEPGLRAELRDRVGRPAAAPAAPGFVVALCAQARAGATRPGRRRLVVEPPESHGDHCLLVAVGAVLLAPGEGADAALPFLAGLAHHLHNARLPDGGFAGEELLGDLLAPVLEELRAQALAELPPALRPEVRAALALVPHASTPEARAFNAADVLDRVLQMRHHAEAAAFSLDRALGEMELVHAGPLQAFGMGVVSRAGLA